MDAYIPPSNNPQKNENHFVPILIAFLIGLLIFQFLYFNRKLKSAQNKTQNSASSGTQNPSQTISQTRFFPRFRSAKSQALQQSPINNPNNAAPMDDFFDEDPFAMMQRIHGRLNQMMQTARTYAPLVMEQMNRDMSSDFMPAIDMEETATAYIVRCDIPGLEKDKINITTKNNMLTIQGVREETAHQQYDQNGFYSSERSYGSFSRTVALPGPVDESGIKADYKDGVLTIQVPKEKSSQNSSRKIAVQ